MTSTEARIHRFGTVDGKEEGEGCYWSPNEDKVEPI